MKLSLFKLLQMTTNELASTLSSFCTKKGKYSYLFLPKGDLKGRICLVAHIDTVWDKSKGKKTILYDKEQGLMWSPQGLGADDRAGVYATLSLLNSLPPSKKPLLLLTDLEESFGVGAEEAASLFKEELSQVSYFIELDRKGSKDCVFYNYEPEDFIDHIESYGFEKALGTFSDISILGSELKKCSVNLSAGYYNEHTLQEYLSIGELALTMEKVDTILRQHNKKKVWELPEKINSLSENKHLLNGEELLFMKTITCDKCGEEVYEDEVIYYGYMCPMCGWGVHPEEQGTCH